jgi:hypothetical protein
MTSLEANTDTTALAPAVKSQLDAARGQIGDMMAKAKGIVDGKFSEMLDTKDSSAIWCLGMLASGLAR